MLFLMSVKNIIITTIVVVLAVSYVLGYIGYAIYKLIKHIPLETCDCKAASKNKKMLKNIRNELDEERKNSFNCSCHNK
ncbi:MAG: hypothetical protein K6E20_05755 [Acholeplasmatales bacterium]|nr:hypothetical protein [Acholeplasmatales bacterium]